MGLAQYPPGAVGSPDDPLADPYDDPSYSFSFRTSEQSRSEDQDATGRVRGLYSFLDDEGERHSVRYAAGAGTGFEVSNSVPDNPASVSYASPLYKAPPGTRGKMSVQRGPGGTYKLIAAGPDHRRAETRTPDGVVRGTYSFLDDKGVQRTVEYIAGAGIGYRVVKNRIGPSTHINPSVADYRLGDTSFKLANDFGTGASASGGGGSGGGSGNGVGSSGMGGRQRVNQRVSNTVTGNGGSTAEYDTSSTGHDNGDNEITIDNELDSETGPAYNTNRPQNNMKTKPKRPYLPRNSPNGKNNLPDREPMIERDASNIPKRNNGRNQDSNNAMSKNPRGPSRRPPNSFNKNYGPSSSGSDSEGSNNGYDYARPGKGSNSNNNYNPDDDDIGTALPPLITANRKILEIDRERDWVERHRDSTVIKNVGKWYIGLPPGQSVRAHVQNIDILPLGGRRVPSPSEALRQDELADMVASFEHEKSNYNS
ncbi:protein SPT2 homolog [Stomoxys calcitrans]|uniref:protein SPT2 homolog n=1 Tax=Stomoxys calcitrans TaxID=35570 RepID=UPI0027E39793|nr:protein SPT2 homolog [Stomoxys calcitrans]XP_059216852.1 protein SPT2 homolog [Stomoxys calcitrans]